jgi:signal transduction histidine kinase
MTAEGMTGAALLLAVSAFAGAELRRRGELVSRACHEARRPLTAAHLVLAAMERGDEDPQERVGVLRAELRRAALALDDLAAAGQGRHPAGRREAVDVRELLEGQAASWALPARVLGRALALGTVPPGLRVAGDRERLARAVANLLVNALEHGGQGIELSARRAGGAVRVEVADDGPGLPASVATLARRPRADGRGRGLAIAGAIARAHRGRLLVAPAARGARIGLELPLLEEAR